MKIAALLPPPRTVGEAEPTASDQMDSASDFEQALTSTYELNSSHPAQAKALRSKVDLAEEDWPEGTPQSMLLTMPVAPAPLAPAPVASAPQSTPNAQDCMNLVPVTADQIMSTAMPSDPLQAAVEALPTAVTAPAVIDPAPVGDVASAAATSPTSAHLEAQAKLLESAVTAPVESSASAATVNPAAIQTPEPLTLPSPRSVFDVMRERTSATMRVDAHSTDPEGVPESGFEVTARPEMDSAQSPVLAEASHRSASMVASTLESEPITADSSEVMTGAPAVAANASGPLTPGPLPTSLAPATPAPVAQQLMARLTPLRLDEDGSHETTLLLHPEDLGPVRIKVHVINQSVSLHLTGTGGQACELLRQALPDLGRELGATGLTLSFADVQEQSFTSTPGREQFTDSGTAHQEARQELPSPAPAVTAVSASGSEPMHLRQHLGLVDVMV